MIRILKEAETNRGEIFAREDPVDSVEEPVRQMERMRQLVLLDHGTWK